MFQQVREIMNWVGESLRNESSYNIMVVPDNGSEIKKAVIGVGYSVDVLVCGSLY